MRGTRCPESDKWPRRFLSLDFGFKELSEKRSINLRREVFDMLEKQNEGMRKQGIELLLKGYS